MNVTRMCVCVCVCPYKYEIFCNKQIKIKEINLPTAQVSKYLAVKPTISKNKFNIL